MENKPLRSRMLIFMNFTSGILSSKTLVYIYNIYIYIYIYIYIHLTGLAKTWLRKFQVHINNLTSKRNGKQLKDRH